MSDSNEFHGDEPEREQEQTELKEAKRENSDSRKLQELKTSVNGYHIISCPHCRTIFHCAFDYNMYHKEHYCIIAPMPTWRIVHVKYHYMKEIDNDKIKKIFKED